MYRSGIELSGSATVFAGQLVSLYTNALGNWSYPIISIAAFTTMLSTTLTCLDAFARILREAYYVYSEKESSHEPKWYNFWIFLTILGSIFIFFFYLKNMKSLVDLATTLSFLVAPIYAILNYKVMKSKEIPTQLHPQGWIKYTSYVGIVFFSAFTLYYIYLKF